MKISIIFVMYLNFYGIPNIYITVGFRRARRETGVMTMATTDTAGSQKPLLAAKAMQTTQPSTPTTPMPISPD